MEETKKCSCGEDHQGHICVLRGLGRSEEIACLAVNPTHACFSCGAEVNDPGNVCQPVPI